MVFQRPNPLPISIYDNVLFGVRLHMPGSTAAGGRKRWSNRHSATCSSGMTSRTGSTQGHRLTLEQQQKLCLARLLPLKPRIILMDEPCSALDAEGIERIEELVGTAPQEYTMVMVTHNMGQARRISQECIFMLLGESSNTGPRSKCFSTPGKKTPKCM